ncbi:MAG: HNH endonuclease signature motif containing protein [Ruthenibacterium sp.]
MCTYCGAIMSRKKMQVDHVVAINRTNKNIFYRFLLKSGDVNELNNMTSACPKCNKKKSDKGGLWILRGKIGPYLFPVVWTITLLVLLALIVGIVAHVITPESVRNVVNMGTAAAANFFTETITDFFRRLRL